MIQPTYKFTFWKYLKDSEMPESLSPIFETPPGKTLDEALEETGCFKTKLYSRYPGIGGWQIAVRMYRRYSADIGDFEAYFSYSVEDDKGELSTMDVVDFVSFQNKKAMIQYTKTFLPEHVAEVREILESKLN